MFNSDISSYPPGRRITPNFRYGEFKCSCSECHHSNHTKQSLIVKLQHARDVANDIVPGTKIRINSGYRCEANNEAVGGTKTSSHLNGTAADIRCTDIRTRGALLTGLRLAGFNRIGIGETFLHVDIDAGKTPNVTWLY